MPRPEGVPTIKGEVMSSSSEKPSSANELKSADRRPRLVRLQFGRPPYADPEALRKYVEDICAMLRAAHVITPPTILTGRDYSVARFLEERSRTGRPAPTTSNHSWWLRGHRAPSTDEAC